MKKKINGYKKRQILLQPKLRPRKNKMKLRQPRSRQKRKGKKELKLRKLQF